MSDMQDIYIALQEGKGACTSLETWVRGADASDRVRSRMRSIEAGLAAYERLEKQLRDGRKHIEPPPDFKATGCMCSWPNASPPCSWCTDPANGESEAA